MGFGLIILVVDLIFFLGEENRNLFVFLAGIAFTIVVLPFIIGIVAENSREKQMNEMFLEFSRNLAESVNTGTPISRSIINMSKKDYGSLSPYVTKLSNQISLGIPVNKALESFARDVDNSVIKRAVALIIEAEVAGGEIDYILESVAKSIAEVEKLKNERRAAIYNLVVQGYIIFFIFIGIMLVMEFKILPLTAGAGSFSGVDIGQFGQGEGLTSGNDFNPATLSRPFLFLLIVQGLFTGLIIGKIAEGSVRSGIKHSFILAITSILVYTGSKLFFG